MKTAKQIILERAGELFCMVHSTTCGKIVEGMEEYARQFEHKNEYIGGELIPRPEKRKCPNCETPLKYDSEKDRDICSKCAG